MTRQTYLLCFIFLMQCITLMLLLPRTASPLIVQYLLTGPALGLLGYVSVLHGKKHGIFLSFLLAIGASIVALVVLFWGWSPHEAIARLHNCF